MIVNNENIDETILPSTLENFTLLREKAIAYLERSATGNWTDFNVHDPGITIMEAICYGLADVGFRMNFPMADLLVDEKGNLPPKSFYYANEILPNHAVTINDFRKILIDLNLIKNAWITPLLTDNEAIQLDYEPTYFYKKEGVLIFKQQVKDLPISQAEKTEILENCKVFVKGLYAINIEFETQPILGNIDSGETFEGIYEKDFFGDIYYDIKNWNELINNKLVLKKIADTYTISPNAITINILNSPKNKFNNSDGKLDERVLSEWYYDLEIIIDATTIFTLKEVLFQPYLQSKKGISGKDLKNILTKNSFVFFNTCFSKIQALSEAYSQIQTIVNANRNLCEDFLPQIGAIPSIEFRICADIDVESKADLETEEAIIFKKIEEYLSPTIPFYTFKELVEKGMPIEDILEGPLLSHGFILEQEMGPNSFQNTTINLSDIINAIYETEGLINCRNVQIHLIDENGKSIENANNWEIKVPDGFKPILNKRKSKLLFYKNGLPLLANFKESIVKLNILNINSIKQTNSKVPAPIFKNSYRDLALHYSLADEFPATYKIGKNLPPDYFEKPEFFKQKQLEGYLLLFEQIIANFLKDLHELKHSLSWETVQNTNFQATDNNWRRSQLLAENVDQKWQNIIQPELKFLKKRNENLGFLLSRFAENLEELDNFFYLSTDNLKINEGEYLKSLIDLKQKFLTNYISISANRGAAVDYYAQKEYLKTSISGYEDRISKLLGAELLKNGNRKKTTDIDITDKNERGYFHLLEHLMLRMPVISDDIWLQPKAQNITIEQLSICTDDDCTACGGHDPFSFTASIALPAWLPIYADVHYRDYIETLIRRETPIGVLLRICWINEESMKTYEQKLEEWWTAKYNLYYSKLDTYNTNLIEFIKKQNSLIVDLKSHRSEYFKATLHGCEDEGEENNSRIFLGKTFLGLPDKPI